MDPYLADVVLTRQMIEHRFVQPGTTMAQAINQVAWEAELSPRYVNMILMEDKRSPEALERIDSAVTRLSDDEGQVPFMCCTLEAVHIIKKYLARGGNA